MPHIAPPPPTPPILYLYSFHVIQRTIPALLYVMCSRKYLKSEKTGNSLVQFVKIYSKY